MQASELKPLLGSFTRLRFRAIELGIESCQQDTLSLVLVRRDSHKEGEGLTTGHKIIKLNASIIECFFIPKTSILVYAHHLAYDIMRPIDGASSFFALAPPEGTFRGEPSFLPYAATPAAEWGRSFYVPLGAAIFERVSLDQEQLQTVAPSAFICESLPKLSR